MNTKNKGFTLIELLVVIAIIGLLSTLTIVAVNYARERARIAKAQHDIGQIYTAISLLVNDTNEWPGHQTVEMVFSGGGNEICGLDSGGGNCAVGLGDEESGIVQNDSAPDEYSGWQGPYMALMPLDPWGYEYFFDTDYSLKNIDDTPCDTAAPNCYTAVVVGSYGPDGLGNNQYNADDIIKVIKR